jgi:uncharacterized SAM-binding protein YcdF (DUF218 family)
MRSVLSSGRSARVPTSAKRLGLLVAGLILLVLSILSIALLVRNPQTRDAKREPVDLRVVLAIPVIGVHLPGVLRIFGWDEEMYREMGFLCPNCHSLLTASRSGGVCVKGLCPQCRKSTLS